MNIVSSGSMYQIYGEAVQTYKYLPVKSFEVAFDRHSGFFLVERSDLLINEEKIYGNLPEKANKIMRSYSMTNRNFGVILSGYKGAGKSLLARVLAQEAIANGMPVITVSIAAPGIAHFLSSIEQEVMIIFDEFEKVFAKQEDSPDPQEELLSLFDGLDNGKKLFVVTCNEVNKLNSYLVNRPGRFHYHFIVTSPDDEEIREYMNDKLDPIYRDKIEDVVELSRFSDLTYDYLRAIAFELDQGYSLEETINDLNIDCKNYGLFDINVSLSDGEIYFTYNEEIRLSRKEGYRICLRDRTGKHCIYLYFNAYDIYADGDRLTLKPDKVSFEFDDYDRYINLSEEEENKKIEEDKSIIIDEVEFIKRGKL